jgi:predicted flap endonuclease-1-like 5' DNA nuclease
MPRWILGVLGVLIFVMLLFASVFVLAVLLLWLFLRKKEAAAPDVEAEFDEYEEEWEHEVEAPALVIAAPELDADVPEADAGVPEVDVKAPEAGVGAAAAAVAAAGLDLEAADVEVDVPEADTGVPEIDVDVPEAETDAQVADAELIAVAPVEPPVPDDLKRIDGIGPKISSVLQAAGITTFAQLAAMDVGEIEEILEAESPRLRQLANPTTWPEQAEAAATGD